MIKRMKRIDFTYKRSEISTKWCKPLPYHYLYAIFREYLAHFSPCSSSSSYTFVIDCQHEYIKRQYNSISNLKEILYCVYVFTRARRSKNFHRNCFYTNLPFLVQMTRSSASWYGRRRQPSTTVSSRRGYTRDPAGLTSSRILEG